MTGPRPLTSPVASRRGLLARLSVMMFLQYAIWGAWLPILYPFLEGVHGFSATEIATIFAVGAIGALLAPFLAGQIADRAVDTAKLLGISHLAGAVVVWQLAWIDRFWMFLAFALVYSLIYAPTLSLTNSLCFHHLPDRDRDFGRVRLWGTVGWIAAGIAMGHWLLQRWTDAGGLLDEHGRADAFRLSALLGVVLGMFAFLLPRTPPRPGRDAYAAAGALRAARRNPLLTLFLLAVPISCIHQFYFVHTATFLSSFQSAAGAEATINQLFGVGGGGLMTIGQIAEIVVLASIPLVAKRISRKALLGAGIAAYAGRMALFAYVAEISSATGLPELAILVTGVALHGLCFGGFIFVAFMVVDEETAPDVRATAQSLFNLVIIGIGIIAGSYVAAAVKDWATSSAGTDYQRLFGVPLWASLASLVVLLLFYPRRSSRRGDRVAADPAPSEEPAVLTIPGESAS